MIFLFTDILFQPIRFLIYDVIFTLDVDAAKVP